MALIENTVEKLGDEALTDSIIDRTIVELVDDTITSLGVSALAQCKVLKKAILPNAVVDKSYVFQNCQALTVADIAEFGVSSTYVFLGCTALDTLILRKAGVSASGSGAPNLVGDTKIASGTGYIYVPAEQVDSYKAHSSWSRYANQFRAIEDYPEVCDPYSWEAVAKNIENGTYKDMYKIGDTVPVDLGSEGIINMQIAAFDADTLEDGSGKAAISWVGKELLATEQNIGIPSTNAGWDESTLRTYCNETVFGLVPENVQELIVKVRKTFLYYSGNGATSTGSTSAKDKVWIPSRKEVFGNGESGSDSIAYTDLFPDNESRVKKLDGSAVTWVTRSAVTQSSFWCCVSATGSTSMSSRNTAYGVCIGFCTGRTPT